MREEEEKERQKMRLTTPPFSFSRRRQRDDSDRKEKKKKISESTRTTMTRKHVHSDIDIGPRLQTNREVFSDKEHQYDWSNEKFSEKKTHFSKTFLLNKNLKQNFHGKFIVERCRHETVTTPQVEE